MSIIDSIDAEVLRGLVADWWHVLLAGSGALYMTSKVIYRRFFHPLANVPGPFLPAVTRLWAWYHNVPRDGKLFLEIERLHEIYGPIIRITPDEVHLSDPSHYDYVYGMKSGFYKDPRFYRALGIDVATFGSIHNEEHRRRRAAMNPFFSRKKVLELEDIVHEKADKLCRILHKDKEIDKATDIGAAFRAISVDVITDYAFGESWGQLDSPDLGAWFSDMVRGSSSMFFTLQAFPTLMFLHSLPPSVAKRMSPAVADFIGCQVRTMKHVEDVQKQVDQDIKPTRQTIFHQLMDPEAAEGHVVPRAADLADEAFAICTAAADTTGNAMGMAAYRTITNPEIYAKVKKELRDAFPDASSKMDFTDLEKLPYLTGIIKEGQRLSYGVISRLPRIVPGGGATLEGFFIPGGCAVSMSSWMMHHNPTAFPDPEVFDPDRWTDPTTYHERDKCLVPFSRGRRMCAGMNLAWCELYVTLGTLFRRFENLEPFDVSDEDMVYQEYFSAFHPPEKRRFRVVVGAD